MPIHDWNFATVLEYAISHLHVNDVVICGHSNCGAIRALDHENTDAYIPLWLNNARDAKTRVDKTIPPPKTVQEQDERYRLIEQENVRLQIEHLHTYPLLKKAVDEQKVQVHGLYYDLGYRHIEPCQLKKRIRDTAQSRFLSCRARSCRSGSAAVHENHRDGRVVLFKDCPDVCRGHSSSIRVSFSSTRSP